VLADIGSAFGIDDVAAAIGKPEIRERLRANTDAAIRRGVFGVPMVAVGDDLFWGEDMTAMLVDRLANPALFDTPELERLRDLPVGIRRH
jgi:2-hydroxychromene-2-carboxylate isomerase